MDYDSKTMANTINDFFCDIGYNLASKIPDSLLQPDYNVIQGMEPLELQLATFDDVYKLLQIPDTKATGNDGIPVRFLKSNLTVTASLIMHIINLSIVSLKVPVNWKSATLTPLYKEGDKTDPANYRPISILPVINKVLEQVVHNQVYKYLSHNKMLSDAQFGFRQGYSMSTCVLNLINTIFNNMENGMMT